MGDIDAALGITTSFDADTFRNAIKFAMQMGAAPIVALRPTFLFKSAGTTYTKGGVAVANPRLDRDGKPLDPDIATVIVADRGVQVDCAIEIARADAEEIPVGNFRPTKAVITVLDDEYALIKGAREMLYDGDRYLYGYEPEALGMFDVGVFTLIFYALQDN